MQEITVPRYFNSFVSSNIVGGGGRKCPLLLLLDLERNVLSFY